MKSFEKQTGEDQNDHRVKGYEVPDYIVGSPKEEKEKTQPTEKERLIKMRERFREISELLDNSLLPNNERVALLLEQEDLARKIEKLELSLISQESPEKQLEYYVDKHTRIKTLLRSGSGIKNRGGLLLTLQQIERKIIELRGY